MHLKRGLSNIVYGLINQIVVIAIGLIIPRLFLVNYGSEVNGLLTSITQVFAYIGLVEAGVGVATLQALYRPISENNFEHINRILAATDRYYKKTGLLYFLIIFVFAFFFPLLVHSSISFFTIFIIILLNGLGGVINFLFQGKFRILLQAEGENYVLTNLGTITAIGTNVVRISLLLMGYNVIVVQSVFFVFNLFQMLYIVHYMRKNYVWIDLKVEPDYDSIAHKNSAFIHQISGLIFNNTDVLLLAIFTNLKVVSVYVMYTMLFNILNTFFGTLSGGFAFILGQNYNNDKKRFMELFEIYEVNYMSIVFAMLTTLFIFILPFMKVYTTGISDISYIDQNLPILFIIIYFLICGRTSSRQVIDFAGDFKNTQINSIIESVINLTSSIILVQFYGIYGVLCGTILALLYRTNDIILYVSKHLLNRSSWITYRRWLINLGLFFIIITLNSFIDLDLSRYSNLLMWGFIYGVAILSLFLLINLFFEKKAFYHTINLIFNNVKLKRT